MDRGIGPGPDLTSLYPQPLHGDLGDDEPEAAGQGQYFDIEGESLGDRAVEEQLGDRGPERLESALRVVEAPRWSVTLTSRLKARFMSDRRRLERFTDAPDAAREPMARSASARARMNCGVCAGVDGHVRVGEGDDRRGRRRHAGPHGAALAAVLGEPEQPAHGGTAEKRAPARAVVSSVLPSSTTMNSVVSGSMAPAAMATRRRATPSSSRGPSL